MDEENLIDEMERVLLDGVNHTSDRVDNIEEYRVLYKKIPNKFSRIEFYNEIQRLIYKYSDNDDMLNELYEIELTIIGHCSELGIEKFINEPDKREILVPYVRSLAWRK